MKQHVKGVALLELLLVLVIAGGILFIGVRQYQTFRLDADLQQLRYNVDNIFRGMTAYYNANCYGVTNPATRALNPPGPLHPRSNPSNPTVVDIASQLVAPGFLQGPFPLNALVTTTGAGTPPYRGYLAQFNQAPGATRTICTSTNCATSTQTGTVIMWTMQVSVLIENTANVTQFRDILNADCLSSAGGGGGVQPCTVGSTGNYLVWERLPSYSASQAQNESVFWISNPTLQQFKQMYTTYPINYLIRGNSPGQIPGSQPQYYLCGS